MKKKVGLLILIVLSFVCILITPISFSKYTTEINHKVIINASQPKYMVVFHPNVLPAEYQEVEYIEATGTQYIDTDVSMDGNYTLYSDGYMTKGNLGVLINGYADSKNRQGMLFYTGSNKYGYYWFGKGYTENQNLTNLGIDLKNRFQITQNKSGLTLTQGSLSVSESYSGNATTHSQKILIFETAAKNEDRFGVLYRAKILNGSTVIKDFVPCYRKSDNVIGLYDLKDNIFYTNSGTGTFIKGDNIEDTTQEITYGNLTPLTANSFSNNGYTFNGWNTSLDGSGTPYSDTQAVLNLTSVNGAQIHLYAQWQ